MESLTPDKTTDLRLAADLFALAHPVRLAIVRQLAEADACCNKDVVNRVGLAQSTVSQHLKILVDAGLVSYQPDKQRSRYSLSLERLNELTAAFGHLASYACNCAGTAKISHTDRTA
jgi:ArsR family transcriptional regulator, arsenate/arsenite/antimonite-responsive transcriptional repressor